jgi:hypothetical protein
MDKTMSKILVNYAAKGTNCAEGHPNGGYVNAQIANSKTGIEIAKFDKVENYNLSRLPNWFFKKHERHFNFTRGAGYWIWKPYIIIDAMSRMSIDDILMYSDSGCRFIHDIKPVIDVMETMPGKVLSFSLAQVEKDWNKRDCFKKLNCDEPKYTDSKQIMSTFFMCKKTELAEHVVAKWYEEVSDFHMVADESVSPSSFPNYPSFKEHRHDQSILSLVCKTNGVGSLEDITEWGNPLLRNMPQIVNHTRQRD